MLFQVGDGEVQLLLGHSGPVYGVDWVPGGGLLSCGEDTTVRYWDRDTRAGLCVYRYNCKTKKSVKWSL